MGLLSSGVVTFGLVFVSTGTAQIMSGIYFVFALASYETWSYVWTGLWDVLVGIVLVILCCFGELSTGRLQSLLALSVLAGIANALNMVVLEVGEWHNFRSTGHPFPTRPARREKDTLLAYAYLSTTVSTALALVTSFVASQFLFCFLFRQRKGKGHRDVLVEEGVNNLLPLSRALTLDKVDPSLLDHYYTLRRLLSATAALPAPDASRDDLFVQSDAVGSPLSFMQLFDTGAARSITPSEKAERSSISDSPRQRSPCPDSPWDLAGAFPVDASNPNDAFILAHYFHSQGPLTGRVSPARSENLRHPPSWRDGEGLVNPSFWTPRSELDRSMSWRSAGSGIYRQSNDERFGHHQSEIHDI